MKILDQSNGGVIVQFSPLEDDVIPHQSGKYKIETIGGVECYICEFTDGEWEDIQIMLNGIIPKSIPKKKGT